MKYFSKVPTYLRTVACLLGIFLYILVLLVVFKAISRLSLLLVRNSVRSVGF